MITKPFLAVLLGYITAWSAQAAWSQSIDPPAGALDAIHAETIRADMGFLADDLLEGRAPGTRGYDIGAAFVASRFAALGLRPGAGAGSYEQSVSLRSMRLDETASSFSLETSHGEQALALRQDMLLWPDTAQPSVEIEAPLVFAGYGIAAPDQHHDDYAHLDVRGKIVVALYGAPAFADPAVKAHFSAGWVKRRAAAAHGAVGYLVLYSEDLQLRYPFEKMVRALDAPRLDWLNAGRSKDYEPTLRCNGALSMAGARRVLDGSGHSLEAVYAAARAGTLRPFGLGARARIRTVTRAEDIKSANVIGILEGSDPALRDEYVVYSAHLDHLGVSTPIGGDAIYNGALDNASGVAAILSVAEAFTHAATRPRRSLLFIAVTGEESGLLGSDYFARFPTVPRASLVANLNIDGAVPLWPIADVMPLGMEHSSLRGPLEAAARMRHLGVSADLHPEQVFFIRSDQYSFVRQGIPSVSLEEGMLSSDPSIDTEKRMNDWEATRYHLPGDDMQQPNMNFDSAAELVSVAFLAGWSIANQTPRPHWNPGDFFGRPAAATTEGHH